MSQADTLLAVLRASPVLPVAAVEDPATAVNLARALAAGGLKTLEITLKTAAGLDCIRAIAGEGEDIALGAGGVRDPRRYEAAANAGAAFVSAREATPELIQAARGSTMPLLPGVTTAGEAMALAEHGYRLLKFFPVEAAGGVAYVKALAVALPAIGFCPTGGIGARAAAAYLGLANVVTVGGSWVAPATAIRAGDWARITRLAAKAAALRG